MRQIFLLFTITLLNIPFVHSQWTPMTHSPNSDSYSMVEYNNELYLGGPFTLQIHLPGPTFSTMRHIAKWNGVSFDTLGFGMNLGGAVSDMVVYDSVLVMVGSFTTANGMSVNKIVQWNGFSFDSLGSGIIGQNVKAIAVYNGELYVGGIFTQAGNVPVNNIARWNGVSWDSVGSGISNQILDLEEYNGELYASGFITSAGNTPVNNIARWNGVSWDSVAGGVDDLAQTMKVYSNELYVGGQFMEADGIVTRGIARWNGSFWAAVGAGFTQSVIVYSLETYNGNLIMSGLFDEVDNIPALNIAKWNGSNWSTLGTGMEIWQANADVNVAFPFQGDLFVAGTFTSLFNSGTTCNYMARYHEDPTLVESVTGNDSMSIYPNPISGQTTLQTNIFCNGATMTLYNSFGQVVQEVNNINGTIINFQRENLSTGLYFIRLENNDKTYSQRLVISSN